MDTNGRETTFTEAFLIDEERRIAQFSHFDPESYAKSRHYLLSGWIRREARIHGWPMARLAAALATELIGIAIDEIHTARGE